MTHEEYLSQLEKKIRILNRVIDCKILLGEKYSKEAKEHRQLLEKVWKHKLQSRNLPVKSNFFNKFFASSFQH